MTPDIIPSSAEQRDEDFAQRLASIKRCIPRMADVGGIWPRDVEWLVKELESSREQCVAMQRRAESAEWCGSMLDAEIQRVSELLAAHSESSQPTCSGHLAEILDSVASSARTAQTRAEALQKERDAMARALSEAEGELADALKRWLSPNLSPRDVVNNVRGGLLAALRNASACGECGRTDCEGTHMARPSMGSSSHGPMKMSGCPCTLVEPCRASCTCANPLQSGGCDRCASYGSREQRVAKARDLAASRSSLPVSATTPTAHSPESKAGMERDASNAERCVKCGEPFTAERPKVIAGDTSRGYWVPRFASHMECITIVGNSGVPMRLDPHQPHQPQHAGQAAPCIETAWGTICIVPVASPGAEPRSSSSPERTEAPPEMDKRLRGLYGKFRVERTDGKSEPGQKHDGCDYFVLDLMHDPFANPALSAYADACRDDFPVLAMELDGIVDGLPAGHAPLAHLSSDSAPSVVVPLGTETRETT